MAKPMIGEPDWGAILNDFLDTLVSRSANLSDLQSISTARNNLELGTAATRNIEAFAPSDATGPPGPAGPPGANGANGLNGLNGNDGEDGADAVIGQNLDIIETYPLNTTPDPPSGTVRISAQTNEGAGTPPTIRIANADGETSVLLTEDEGAAQFIRNGILSATPPGTLLVRSLADPDYAGFLLPGTNGQILTADDTEDLGLKWVDP